MAGWRVSLLSVPAFFPLWVPTQTRSVAEWTRFSAAHSMSGRYLHEWVGGLGGAESKATEDPPLACGVAIRRQRKPVLWTNQNRGVPNISESKFEAQTGMWSVVYPLAAST
jgi:hypothetical protein